MNTSTTEEVLATRPSVNLLGLMSIILRSKRSIALAGAGCALCGLLLALVLPPDFESSTEVLPPQGKGAGSATMLLSQATLGSGDAGALMGMGSAIQAKSTADMYAVMMAARPDGDALIQRFGLQQAYRASTMTKARIALAAHTSIVVTKEGFITISVRDHDPERAAGLANGYVEELRKLMGTLALTEASQRRAFYEGQLARSREDLAQAELAFRQVQQESKVVSLDLQAKSLIEGVAGLRAQVAAKEVELQGLRSYSTEANPQVQMAEKGLAVLRAQLAQSDSRGGGPAPMGLGRVPEAELGFVRASRALKYQEGLYDLLNKQYEGSRIDEARDAPVVQVIEPAIVPEKPNSPRMLLFVLGALVFGLIAGVLRILYRGWRVHLDGAESARLSELRLALLHW